MTEYDIVDFGKMIQRSYKDHIFMIKWENNENGNNPPMFYLFNDAVELWQTLLTDPKYDNLTLIPYDEDQTNYPKPNIQFDDQSELFSICYSCEDSYDLYKVFSHYNKIKAVIAN